NHGDGAHNHEALGSGFPLCARLALAKGAVTARRRFCATGLGWGLVPTRIGKPGGLASFRHAWLLVHKSGHGWQSSTDARERLAKTGEAGKRRPTQFIRF